ncbi:Protein of unknown function DUF4666 [Dillenia turbinata]|uniref:MAPK kinase substrate protein At1g80180-like n=1 Tax=Dillenia turbinata TaxID=194707 RepID=A0AAN8UG70_9MAGN
MAGLQRSSVSFRRQGSSGLVWEDRFLSGELAPNPGSAQDSNQDRLPEAESKLADSKPPRNSTPAVRSINTAMERSRSNGGGRGFRTGRVSPAIEPPSPKVSACGFCAAFGKPMKNHHNRHRSGKRSRS